MPLLRELVRRRITGGKVGLVLGSGGSKGFAHIGVIQVLEEMGVPIHVVVGTSAGALVAAVWAAGRLPEFYEKVRELGFLETISFFDPVFPRTSLLGGRRIRKFIREYLDDLRMEELKPKTAVMATDLVTGQPVILDYGPAADAVMASVSIPGFFPPVKLFGRLLIDGGVSRPLPLDAAHRLGADLTIAVNLHIGLDPVVQNLSEEEKARPVVDEEIWQREDDEELIDILKDYIKSGREVMEDHEKVKTWLDSSRMPNIYRVILGAFGIMELSITRNIIRRSPPTVLIEPNLLGRGIFEFQNGEEAVEEGRRAAKTAKKEIKKKIIPHVRGAPSAAKRWIKEEARE